jgi:hypothetical protein
MPEIKNDQLSQQSPATSGQQTTQQSSDPDLNKVDIKVQETEEWDAVITDERRPQFRYNENFGRRNF